MSIVLIDTTHSELDPNNAVGGFVGTQAGDVALIWVYHGTDSPAISPPTGWVLVTTAGGAGESLTVGVHLYRKLLTNSEPSSYDFGPSFIGTHISGGAWRNVNPSSPIEAFSSDSFFDIDDPVSTWDIPSVTTLTDGALCVAGLSHSSAVGANNLETSVEDYEFVSKGPNNWLPMYSLAMPTAGATGAKAVTMEDPIQYYFPIVAVLKSESEESEAPGDRNYCASIEAQIN